MKIAISQWQGRISPVFDVAQEVLLVDLKGSRVLEKQRASLTPRNPFEQAREMVSLGTELLICGAISLAYEKALIGSGIHVIGFCCGEVEAVLVALKKGQFAGKRFRMPGFNGQKVNFNRKTMAAGGKDQRQGTRLRGGRHQGRPGGAVLKNDS